MILDSLENSQRYFLDAYTPNEGESSLVLEVAVLKWSELDSERPEVYVHSYLQPSIGYSRIRWANAVSEMKISRSFIDEKGDLPSIEDIVDADLLNSKDVVCFDSSIEPFDSLTMNCPNVFSISSIWAEIYADDEKALNCKTLNQMCSFIGIVPDDGVNTNYTPLLKRVFKMATLWSFLKELLKHPKRKKSLSFGGLQFSVMWPLPKTDDTWFENEPKALSDLSDKDINDFFTSNLSDKINWFDMSMYGSDWMFNRTKRPTLNALTGKTDLAYFIFNKILSFKMQIWVLIFYSYFLHENEDGLKIALHRGEFTELGNTVSEKFTKYIITNLDVFLSPSQKSRLIGALINQSLIENDKVPFEHYDYDHLKKHQKPNDMPKLIFTPNNDPSGKSRLECFKEIRDANGRPIYRRYEVKGRGATRKTCIDLVNKHLENLMREASDPFSNIWLTPDLKLWIQYIIGINFSDIMRSQRINDSDSLNSARVILKKIIEREATPFLKGLYEKLKECSALINNTESNAEVPPVCFNFQGISIEVMIIAPSKMSFLKNLFTFE